MKLWLLVVVLDICCRRWIQADVNVEAFGSVDEDDRAPLRNTKKDSASGGGGVGGRVRPSRVLFAAVPRRRFEDLSYLRIPLRLFSRYDGKRDRIYIGRRRQGRMPGATEDSGRRKRNSIPFDGREDSAESPGTRRSEGLDTGVGRERGSPLLEAPHSGSSLLDKAGIDQAGSRSLLPTSEECQGRSDSTFTGKGVPRPDNAAAAYSLLWNQDSGYYPGDETIRSPLGDDYPKIIYDNDLERSRSVNATDKQIFSSNSLPGVSAADISAEQSFSRTTGKRKIVYVKKKRARSFIGKRDDWDYEDKRSRSYIGKRNNLDADDKRGRSFIGKRNDLDADDKRGRSFIGKRNYLDADDKRGRSFIGKRNYLDVDEKRGRSFIGKRDDLDYEDKRSRPYIGKRNNLDVDDKRGRSFIGKRDDLDYEDKRGRSFIGKRDDLEFDDKRGRSFIGKRDYLDVDEKRGRSFIGKRDDLDVDGKRARSFIGKRNVLDYYDDRRSRPYIGKRNDLDVDEKRGRSFIGKRNVLDFADKPSRSYIGRRGDLDFEGKRSRSYIGKRTDFYSDFDDKRGRSFIEKGQELQLKYTDPRFDEDDNDNRLFKPVTDRQEQENQERPSLEANLNSKDRSGEFAANSFSRINPFSRSDFADGENSAQLNHSMGTEGTRPSGTKPKTLAGIQRLQARISQKSNLSTDGLTAK